MENGFNSWRWSVNNTLNPGGYQNWTLNKPDNVNASEHCGIMWNGQWDDVFCNDALPFVCFNGSTDPGLKNYTFVSTNMMWPQALSHCRQHYTDLAMIMDEDENTAVASVIPPSTAVGVWIGLHRNPWQWIGSGSRFTNWATGQPDNNNGVEHCAIMDADSLWRDENCELARPFYCRHDFKTKVHRIKLTLQTGANLSDPFVYNQIIQQIGAKFKDKGLADFKLIWKPQKV
uniref:C-type lectin domain-containing protein n=1 Tax=Neogobius melanostomus TaxID=47308 RepID=A0A8C6SGQ0_9GOBI